MKINGPSRQHFNLRCGSQTLSLGTRTVVMGVLNVTPDSFSDGGRYADAERAVRRGLEMVRQGADWIDVGGESTRPGARTIPVEEELSRVLPVIRGLRRKTPAWISIDTRKSQVAAKALENGANLINDVSGLRFDPRLASVAKHFRCSLVLMHSRGTPATMQKGPFPKNIWQSVRQGLSHSTRKALQAGVQRSQLILDPGFGFGKSLLQNFELLARLDRLASFRLPILVGTSRKSFLQRTLGKGSLVSKSSPWPLTVQGIPPEIMVGTAASVVAAILSGAHIVRVHDVRQMLPAVRIADVILNPSGGIDSPVTRQPRTFSPSPGPGRRQI